jgi:glycosyltransferase involved in cell wall biosynthesis
MKIGFAARWSPGDKRSWSGTSHYTYEQIRKNFETEIFHFKWNWLTREWLTSQKSVNRKLFKKHTSVEFLKPYARFFSRKLSKALRERPVDLLFVSASPQLISYLEVDVPIIYMTDATFWQIQGYYPYFSNLASYNIRQGVQLDKMAFQQADHLMLASGWCRDSAIKDYGIRADKISVFPCGANMQVPENISLEKNPTTGQCRILFLAVEWDRKGGDLVMETFSILKSKGVQPALRIVGCIPPSNYAPDPAITVIPFLDKNDPGQLRELQRIFSDTDFLLLPTRAECAGVVFSEASAFGVPSITTDTGGVSTYVRNGINGYALPLSAGASDYANRITDLLNSPGQIQALRTSSRAYYEQNLAWDHWGNAFREIAESLLIKRKMTPRRT